MSQHDSHAVTQILESIKAGDLGAEERLFELVYQQLRRLAHGRMIRESVDNTLQTTALVHEAYLRLFRNHKVDWDSRRHFFGAAARAMRQILIDRARRRRAEVHGGGMQRITLAEDQSAVETSIDILDMDSALDRLAGQRPQHADIVKLRYFLGFTVEETAQALGISQKTVNNRWAFARAWLRRELSGACNDK
jgi:RNA polymerase sigma factor (TIGR02999 family)